MRSLRTIALVAAASSILAAACSAPSDHAGTPASPTSTAIVVSVPDPAPATASSSEPAPDPTTEPGPPAPPKPESSTYADLVDAPGDARLTAGAESLKSNEANRARQALSKVMPDIDVSGSLDAKMAAHALLGRACQSLGDAKCAAAHYQTVRELWKDPAAGQKAIEADGGDDGAKIKRLGRALNAAGEALYYAAEEKRLLAENEKMPEYKGSGKREAVLKHVNTKVAAWVKARRKAVEEAEKAYSAIVALQPVPPPRWVLSASSRVGELWGSFARQFRSTPVPGEWKKNGAVPGTPGLTYEELRTAYYTAIDEASEPMMARARAAYKTCQDLSAKYAYTDALTKRCDDWLSKNTPASNGP